MGGKLLINGLLATMDGEHGGYGLLPEGALAIKGEFIDWVGPAAALPDRYANWPRQDLAGRLVTPALIDCHTHLVFGGDRAQEFEMRLNGANYRQIAEAGGGIVSTVRQTRRLSEEELVQAALPRLDALLAEGVGTVEIKSGYGLTIDDELKMLRAARQLGDRRRVRIKTTFLAAHAVPQDYAGRAEAYIDEVCLPALDLAHEQGLVDAVDAFCEGIGFSVAQVEKVFRRAEGHGIALKLHAEQLSNLGGAAMAARHKALSADHLEFLDDAGAVEMARAGTVAVLLPGAYYTLGEGRRPPVEALRRAGVAIAVASDCNPGSSPLTSLLLAANMACTLFKLTPQEALAGITRQAAAALGLANETGVLAAGKRADLAIWEVRQPAELAYRIGFNPLYKRYFGGQ